MTAHRNKPKADIDFVLKRTFKKDSFRSVQREVIEATLAGFDVYIQASTGRHDGP